MSSLERLLACAHNLIYSARAQVRERGWMICRHGKTPRLSRSVARFASSAAAPLLGAGARLSDMRVCSYPCNVGNNKTYDGACCICNEIEQVARARREEWLHELKHTAIGRRYDYRREGRKKKLFSALALVERNHATEAHIHHKMHKFIGILKKRYRRELGEPSAGSQREVENSRSYDK